MRVYSETPPHPSPLTPVCACVFYVRAPTEAFVLFEKQQYSTQLANVPVGANGTRAGGSDSGRGNRVLRPTLGVQNARAH